MSKTERSGWRAMLSARFVATTDFPQAAVAESFTGQYLAPLLDGRVAAVAPAAPKPRRGRRAAR